MGLNVHVPLSDNNLPGPSDIGVELLVTPGSGSDEFLRKDLHEILVPSAFRAPWTDSEAPVHLYFYYIRFVPIPEDRQYRMFGLFVKFPLPNEAETMETDLHLLHGRIVKTALVPSGWIKFDRSEIMLAQKFQEMSLKIILDRSVFFSDFDAIGEINESQNHSSTFYLLLPVKMHDYGNNMIIDWEAVRRCLSSPIFGNSFDSLENLHPMSDTLHLGNGSFNTCDILNSLVFTPHNKHFFFIHGINHEKNAYSCRSSKYPTYADYYKQRGGAQLLYPEQPFLIAKQLPRLRNLLINRSRANTMARESVEYFLEFPPELCHLKIIGFSKDIGSSLTLLPSLMHHLENFLVAIELKDTLSINIPQAFELRADIILQAVTTETCMERFSVERFEVLGAAFLKYSVGRHSFLSNKTFGEGELTKTRASVVSNLHLYELAIKKNLQVYIQDELFDPSQFYALGRPCTRFCSTDTETEVHSKQENLARVGKVEAIDVKCIKSHRWLSRKTISNVVEALVGVFLVESGFKAAISFLKWIGIQVDIVASDLYEIYGESKRNMSLIDSIDVTALEMLLGYNFQHKGLLLEAFLHPSYKNRSGGGYQRLEFLGDAVLEYLITSYLYSVYPEIEPGHITDLRSSAISNKSLAYTAVEHCFHLHIMNNSNPLTEAIKKFEHYAHVTGTQGELLEEPACPKVLGDIVESCTGAILVDTGFNLAIVWKFMLQLLEGALNFSSLQLNPLRELRELCQCHELKLGFSTPIRKKEGHFVELEIDGKGNHLTCSAVNNNSRAAQAMAAQEALSTLKARGFKQKNKPLEEILGSTRKDVPELIGYDEEPVLLPNIDTPLSDESLQDLEKSSKSTSAKTVLVPNFDSQESDESLQDLRKSCKMSSPKTALVPNIDSLESEETPQGLEKSCKLSSTQTMEVTSVARSQLCKICAVNGWSPPSYVLCGEEGAAHQRMFSFKVIIEVDSVSSTLLECYGEPKPQKKAAQEHAAEGAIWYLKHLGYDEEKGKRKFFDIMIA